MHAVIPEMLTERLNHSITSFIVAGGPRKNKLWSPLRLIAYTNRMFKSTKYFADEVESGTKFGVDSISIMHFKKRLHAQKAFKKHITTKMLII